MKNRVLVWAYSGYPQTGQSLVTDRTCLALELRGFGVRRCAYKAGVCGLLLLPFAWMKFFVMAAKCRNLIVYISPSRSAFGFLRDLPVLVFALVRARRVLAHIHGSDFGKLLGNRYVGKLATVIYERCELILPSEHLVSALADEFVDRYHLIENPNFGLPAYSSVRENKGTFRLLWNSNVLASKGFTELVSGAQIAKAVLPGLTLTILGNVVGDGMLSIQEMRRFVEQSAKLNWITVVGPVNHERSRRELLECDIVALPSYSECQPLSIIEAMCAGKRIILSDIPALRSTCGSYPAIFTEINSIAIANALINAFNMGPVHPTIAEDARARFSLELYDGKIIKTVMM